MPLVISTKQRTLRIGSFNIVLSDLPECPKGTKKLERDYADLKSATSVLTEVDNSIQPLSIRDTVRLGKFNPTGSTMLVTLNRSADVTPILSKRVQAKPPYVIKPDLSREATTIESHLLKVQWSLIQANTPKSDIKVRGNKLLRGNCLAKLTFQDSPLPLIHLLQVLQWTLKILPLFPLPRDSQLLG